MPSNGDMPPTNAARHSMTTPEWYTPTEYVEAAREVMGGIDLDPASCEEANRVVRATTFYTAEQDGLIQHWNGRVFLNPPGGKRNGKSLTSLFWAKLVNAYMVGDVSQAIWIGYSLEQRQTLQNAGAVFTPLQTSICIPRRRIAFVSPSGQKNSPSHGNYIAYLGSNPWLFAEKFGGFGSIKL